MPDRYRAIFADGPLEGQAWWVQGPPYSLYVPRSVDMAQVWKTDVPLTPTVPTTEYALAWYSVRTAVYLVVTDHTDE